jgi:hypothetical protein
LVEESDGVAAGLVGVTIGIELGLDIRAFGPFPEELLEFLFTFGLFNGNALLFQGEPAGDEVATTKSDDVAEERADFAEVGFGLLGYGGGMGGRGEASSNPVDEVVDEGRGNCGYWIWLDGRGRERTPHPSPLLLRRRGRRGRSNG